MEQRIALRDRLSQGTVADVMRPPPPAIPAGTPLTDALDRHLRDADGKAFPVVDDGRVIGTVSMASARKVGARDPLRPVRDGMIVLAETPVVAPDESLDDALEWVGSRQGLVLQDGRLVGSDHRARRGALVPAAGSRASSRTTTSTACRLRRATTRWPFRRGPTSEAAARATTAAPRAEALSRGVVTRDYHRCRDGPPHPRRRAGAGARARRRVAAGHGRLRNRQDRRVARALRRAGRDRATTRNGSSSWWVPGARAIARAPGLLGRLASSLPGLQVLTIHGLANRVLKERFAALGYAEPPQVLSAAEQFARVRELLDEQDPAGWPAYGHLLACAGSPTRSASSCSARARGAAHARGHRGAAAERGLTGWDELARFLGEYQAVMDDLERRRLRDAAAAGGAVAGQTASRSSTTCWSTTTRTRRSRPKRSWPGCAPPGSLVVAADPDAHVFSFQGTSRRAARPVRRDVPGRRDASSSPTTHRAPVPPTSTAWIAPHTQRGARRDRARAPPAARRRRRPVVRSRGRRPAAGRTRRVAAARARRRAGAAGGPRARAVAHGRAGDVPVRAGAPLAGRRRAATRASSSSSS